jgi:hypothetical protein
MKVEIPEETIFKAIELYKALSGGEEPVQYIEALSIGRIFKKEGLTPMYLIDETDSTFTVTSEENFLGELN